MVALLGIRGNGKTQLAIALIRAACEAGRSGRYVKRLDLSRAIRRTFAAPAAGRGRAVETEADVIDELAGVGLLVIDEVHQSGESDFDANVLVNLIDRRYDAMKSTILVTNHQTREDFSKAVGDSIVSRLHETGEVIVCDWPSYRRPGMWREAGAACPSPPNPER